MLGRMTTAVVGAALTVMAIGCSRATPGVATATPPKFPDLNAFQAVDPAPYTMQFGRGGGGVFFSTPDGLQCGWASLANGPDDHVSAVCDGPIPGLPDGAPPGRDGCQQVGVASTKPTDLGPYGFHDGGCPAITAPVLNVGQKLTAANTTCLVGADRLTACIDPGLNRGFVLQPSGSWTF
ncbi:hypothetical protein A5695_17795 [Mycobacterium sp. E1747]|nr:hypothetical protein A5695_17795 [Mycobacterium sp. E1747]